jgi:hypothetical protein
MFDREIAVPTLTPVAQFAPGVSSVEFSFTVEMSGHVSNGAAAWASTPAWARIIEFCGWENLITSVIPITSYDAGTIVKPWETMDEVGAGTAQWNACGGAVSGLHTDVAAEAVSGVPIATDQYDGLDSNTRITIGAPVVNRSLSAHPISDPLVWKSASIIYFVDGKRLKLKGARATPEFIMEHGRPPRIRYTFQAIMHEYVDGVLLTGADRPAITTKEPVSYLGVGMQLHDRTAAYSPVHNQLSIAQGNNLVLREASGDAQGWSFASIAARQFTGSFNIDEDKVAGGHDFQDDYETGRPLSMDFTIGATQGSTLNFRVPSMQLTGLSESERDSVTTWDASFALVGAEFPLEGGNTVTIGEEDEVTVINT